MPLDDGAAPEPSETDRIVAALRAVGPADPLAALAVEAAEAIEHLVRALAAATEIRLVRHRSDWSADTREFVLEHVMEPNLAYVLLVSTFAEILRAHEPQAVNYVEQTVERDPASSPPAVSIDMQGGVGAPRETPGGTVYASERFTVTIVRGGGRTPHQLRRDAERDAEALRESLGATRRRAAKAAEALRAGDADAAFAVLEALAAEVPAAV